MRREGCAAHTGNTGILHHLGKCVKRQIARKRLDVGRECIFKIVADHDRLDCPALCVVHRLDRLDSTRDRCVNRHAETLLYKTDHLPAKDLVSNSHERLGRCTDMLLHRQKNQLRRFKGLDRTARSILVFGNVNAATKRKCHNHFLIQ